MVARLRLSTGAAVLLCLLLPLLAGGQWDSEGRPVVVGLSDIKAMKGLKLLGKDLAEIANAQGDAGAPRVGQAWCNATSYGRSRSRMTLCAPLMFHQLVGASPAQAFGTILFRVQTLWLLNVYCFVLLGSSPIAL